MLCKVYLTLAHSVGHQTILVLSYHIAAAFVL